MPREVGLEKAQTILVTEDDLSVRELIAFLLEKDGYTVLKARNSREAVFISEAFPGPIHLLMTDLDMTPYANGCELARQLRESRPNLRVMYVSGYVEDEALHEELINGAVFLPKPFTPGELLNGAHRALEVTVPTL